MRSDVAAVFKEVLGIDSYYIDMKLGDIPEWDSLKHSELICAMENRFQIRFLPSEIEQVIIFKELEKTIRRKLEEKEDG